MKTMFYPKGRLLLCACLALSASLQPQKTHAQLASFTRAYDANNFTLVQRNNTNMIVTPYYGRPISPFDDRGYLIASNIDNGSGMFVVKLTATRSNGDQLWTRSYGDNSSAVRCFAITRDARDNGYVLTGYRSTPATAKRRDALWLLKVDASGNPVKEYTLSADSIPCSKGSGPFTARCHSFAKPSYYGLDILQVTSDPDSVKNGDFVICGFVSESYAVENYAVLKRNFVWRFHLTPGNDTIISAADPTTRFLKIYHSWGNAGSDNEPTSEDFATDVQEIEGHGIMVLGHVTGEPITPSPPSVPRRPYYALMNYNGGGVSTVPATVFQYSKYTNTPDIKNVRSLYGKDDVIYLLNYYYPTHSFAITPVKTTSGGAGLTRIYYSPDATDVPAFSFYQNTTNSDELVVMGYRLKLLSIDDQASRSNFLHPYTIKVSKGGGILSKFNLDSIRSQGYVNYAPANPDSNRDYFRPFEKVFPLASIPNIGMLNTHLNMNDAEVASALYGTTSGFGSKYYATLTQFKQITNPAECHPYKLGPAEDSVLLPYDDVVFNINNIAFKVSRFTTETVDVGAEHKCGEIPAQRTVAGSVTIQAVNEDVHMYPNPASDVLNLQSFSGNSYTYKVTDITGAAVYSGSFTYSDVISVRNWAAGVYLVHITGTNGQQQMFKFVKQ